MAFLSEVANKLVPLINLHLVATRLGVEAFGVAQFALWLIDWGVIFTSFGFSQVAPIMLRDAKNAADEQQINGSVLLARIGLATIAFSGLAFSVRTGSSLEIYQTAVLSSAFILVSSALDATWILVAKQKLALWSFISITAKIGSVVAIALFIQSPDDYIKFVVISNFVNSIISVGSFLVALKIVGISKPNSHQVVNCLSVATPFAFAAIFLIVTDRFDLFLVEKTLGALPTGIYSAASKLVGSFTPIVAAIVGVFYSEMLVHREASMIERHVKASIFWVITMVAPIAVGIWFVDTDIIRLVFGEAYTSGSLTLSILTLGVFFHAAILVFGFQLLALKHHWRPLLLGLILGITVGLVFSVTWIHTFGMTGVATAAIIGKGTAALIIVLFAVRLWHLDPTRLLLDFTRALTPAFVMGFLTFLAQYFTVIPTAFWSTVAFAGTIYTLTFAGLNQIELKAIIASINSRLRAQAT